VGLQIQHITAFLLFQKPGYTFGLGMPNRFTPPPDLLTLLTAVGKIPEQTEKKSRLSASAFRNLPIEQNGVSKGGVINRD
jgi:hypothetical protein